MKTLLVKLQFKLASWLYDQGIIAPQLLVRPDGTSRRTITILTPEESAELMTPIEDLNFSARTTNALINNEIHTLKDLFSLSDNELKELKGFGAKALDEVKDKMAEMEL